MTGHTQKQCPRCNASFECKSGSNETCQCETIPLTGIHREHIAARYTDCLCVSCLVELRRKYTIDLE